MLMCLASIKLYTFYAPFREDDDDFLQELAQWQLFMVLFVSVLDRLAQVSDAFPYESNFDNQALGYLLVSACTLL